jgi:hypothetical protein
MPRWSFGLHHRRFSVQPTANVFVNETADPFGQDSLAQFPDSHLLVNVAWIGLRRGRRYADSVRVGEALDFWRVEAVEPNHLMRLRAEMKLPGKAWLQFEVKAQDHDSRALLDQTAFFAPKELSGLVYWYALYPIHSMIFGGMIQKLARRAAEIAADAKT